MLASLIAFIPCISSYSALILVGSASSNTFVILLLNPIFIVFYGACGFIFLTLAYIERGKEHREKMLTHEREEKPRRQWSPRSWQGTVIQALLQSKKPLTWRELQIATDLNKKELNRALSDLIEFQDIYRIAENEDNQVRYLLSDEYYSANNITQNQKDEPLEWINRWKEVKKLDFSTDVGHFFLESRYLDDFSKELISHAESEVSVANPYILRCSLSDTLVEVKKKGIEVRIITQPPKDKNPVYLNEKQEYHSTLRREGISMLYDKRVHAKIIVVDNKIAVVSSMNFFANSSAGASWEAGIVSADPNVVQDVSRYLSRMFNNVTEFQKRA